jgi:predicted RNA-binding protein with PUA-like domain
MRRQERLNPMAYWLFKEEPEHYNIADLERDKTTLWDGVTNNLARMNLRKVAKGDRVFFYHTGKEKAVVGEMKVIGSPCPDPQSEDPKSVVVKVQAVRRLEHPVPLDAIKKEKRLAGWDLVRISRLSIVPVTEEQWKCVEELSRKPASKD